MMLSTLLPILWSLVFQSSPVQGEMEKRKGNKNKKEDGAGIHQGRKHVCWKEEGARGAPQLVAKSPV